MTDLRVAPDPERLSELAAREVVEVVRHAVALRGRATIALSGGSTPRRLYARLGEQAGSEAAWAKTDLFWVDERFVPTDRPESNYRLVRETLLSGGHIPPERVHPVPTDARDVVTAGERYDAELHRFFTASGPTVDLAVMGIGPDGHTASLFPGTSALDERARWAVAVAQSPVPPSVPRVTLTLPFLNRSRCVLFLAVGAEKAEIVHRAVEEPGDGVDRLPAARIAGLESTVFFLDAAAAGQLSSGGRNPGRGIESPK